MVTKSVQALESRCVDKDKWKTQGDGCIRITAYTSYLFSRSDSDSFQYGGYITAELGVLKCCVKIVRQPTVVIIKSHPQSSHFMNKMMFRSWQRAFRCQFDVI